MQAGKLRHRLTLEAPGETLASGEPTIPWTTQATVWGSMEGLSGTSRTGITAESGVRFRIRYRSDITARWRIGLSGTSRKFQLVSPPIDEEGRRRDLVLVTQEQFA